MSHHSFEIQIARDYDVDTAIILNSIHYWVSRSAANKKHFHDGRYWFYNTREAWVELFPYWTVKQLRRILGNAEKSGLIITGNYNKRANDKTKWYTLSDEAMKYFPDLWRMTSQGSDNSVTPTAQTVTPTAQTGTPTAQTGTPTAQTGSALPITDPITDPITYTAITVSDETAAPAASNEKPKTQVSGSVANVNNSAKGESTPSGNKGLKTPSGERKLFGDKPISETKGEERKAYYLEMVKTYHKVFPDNPKHLTRTLSTDLKRVLDSLVKEYPNIVDDGHPLTLRKFQSYLVALHNKAHGFATSEYVTADGRTKKNNLITFARVNTVVKFKEGYYS